MSEVAQSCPTLCNPMDCSLSGSSVNGIFQVRVLERVAISFFRESSWPRDRTCISHIVGRGFLLSEPPGKSQTYVELSLVQDCDFAKELWKEKGNQRCTREKNDNNRSCKLGTEGSEDTQRHEFQWIVDRITLLEVPEGLKGCWG